MLVETRFECWVRRAIFAAVRRASFAANVRWSGRYEEQSGHKAETAERPTMTHNRLRADLNSWPFQIVGRDGLCASASRTAASAAAALVAKIPHHVHNVHLTPTWTIDRLLITAAPNLLRPRVSRLVQKYLVVERRAVRRRDSAYFDSAALDAARGSTLPTNLKSRILGIAPPHSSQSSRECRLNARTILGHPRLNSHARPEHGSVRRQHVVY